MTKLNIALEKIYKDFNISDISLDDFLLKYKKPQDISYIQGKTKLTKVLECVFNDYNLMYNEISLKNFIKTYNIKNEKKSKHECCELMTSKGEKCTKKVSKIINGIKICVQHSKNYEKNQAFDYGIFKDKNKIKDYPQLSYLLKKNKQFI